MSVDVLVDSCAQPFGELSVHQSCSDDVDRGIEIYNTQLDTSENAIDDTAHTLSDDHQSSSSTTVSTSRISTDSGHVSPVADLTPALALASETCHMTFHDAKNDKFSRTPKTQRSLSHQRNSDSTIPYKSSGQNSDRLMYQFHIPLSVAGKFIGASGRNVNSLKRETDCSIWLRPKDSASNGSSVSSSSSTCKLTNKLCIIEGTTGQIDKCLNLVRDRFPLQSNPDMSLAAVHLSLDELAMYDIMPNESNSASQPPTRLPCACTECRPLCHGLCPRMGLLPLVCAGVEYQVTVSAIVSPGHIFVQLTDASSTQNKLAAFDQWLNDCYNNEVQPAPYLTTWPPLVNTVCVAGQPLNVVSKEGESAFTWWSRVIVAHVDMAMAPDFCVVRSLDYGGYMSVHRSQLKQIRSDLLVMPFHAVECYLADIRPPPQEPGRDVEGESVESSTEFPLWPDEAANVLSNMIADKCCSIRLNGYAVDGVPYITLTTTDPVSSESVVVNDQLVQNGHAARLDSSESSPPAGGV